MEISTTIIELDELNNPPEIKHLGSALEDINKLTSD